MKGRCLKFPIVDPTMIREVAEHQQRWWERVCRTDLKFRVFGKAKQWEVVLDALEKFLGCRLLLQLPRRQSASQHRKMGDRIGTNLLRFDLCIESFKSKTPGERGISTQPWGSRGR